MDRPRSGPEAVARISCVFGRGASRRIPRIVVDELTKLQAQSAPSELVFPPRTDHAAPPINT